MTDFITDCLEMLPEPAALFEAETLGFVAANAAATRLVGGIFDPPNPREAVAETGLDVQMARAALLNVGSYSATLEAGRVHITKLVTEQVLSRPDLLLVTVHPDAEPEDAWLAHQRMLLAVRVNESGEIALRNMESGIAQLQAALVAQHDLLRNYNHRVAEFMRLSTDLKKNP